MPQGRFRRYFFSKLLRLSQLPRIWKYKALSNCEVRGRVRRVQPVQFVGNGVIEFTGAVTIGYFPSPYFLNGYCYIEARNPSARVRIGNGTIINNNFMAVSEHKQITIGERVLIGTFVEIYDSDFHGLKPGERRVSPADDAKEVIIEDDVFIGSNVKILKGVTIGKNSVIANGSIVTRDIPPDVIAGGNPAKILKGIDSDPR